MDKWIEFVPQTFADLPERFQYRTADAAIWTDGTPARHWKCIFANSNHRLFEFRMPAPTIQETPVTADDKKWVAVIPVEGAKVPEGCEVRYRYIVKDTYEDWTSPCSDEFNCNQVFWHKKDEFQARMPAPTLTMPMSDEQWEALSRKEQYDLLEPFESAWMVGGDVEYLHNGVWYPFTEVCQMRLKPKPEPAKPLEVWVNVYENYTGPTHATEQAALNAICDFPVRTAKFVEVIEEGGE